MCERASVADTDRTGAELAENKKILQISRIMSGSFSIDKVTQHKLKMLEADSNGSYLCVTCNFSTGFIAIDAVCDGCGSKFADVEKLCNNMHAQLSASFTEFKELKDHFTLLNEADLAAIIDKYRDMTAAVHSTKKAKLDAATKKYIKARDEGNTHKWIEFQHNQLDQLKNKAYADIEKMA